MNPAAMLPTYNEAENIAPLTRRILAVRPDITVVIVDDNSPDGTGRIADELAAETGRVRVLHRYERRGRGYAGAAGLRYCVEQGFDPIIEMDADFSHDPEYIPRLIEAAQDCDVVLGSRAVAGGGEAGRGLMRRFVTAGAALYLRIMLGVRNVHDPTSGYRCFRRGALEAIRLETLTSQGPPIVTEILYRCRNLRIRETPIFFKERERGRSKFNIKAMRQSLTLAARLRFTGR